MKSIIHALILLSPFILFLLAWGISILVLRWAKK